MGENPKEFDMLTLFQTTQVYFAREPVDMRKQIDGLALHVQEVFELNPCTPALFAFCNRQKDKVKILFWHDNGFCLIYKRIEKGRFQWPKNDEPSCVYSARDLMWLLDGLSLSDLKPQKKLSYMKV